MDENKYSWSSTTTAQNDALLLHVSCVKALQLCAKGGHSPCSLAASPHQKCIVNKQHQLLSAACNHSDTADAQVRSTKPALTSVADGVSNTADAQVSAVSC